MNHRDQNSAGAPSSPAETIAALYDRTFARVYNTIRYRVADAAAAEELAAQVYERAILADEPTGNMDSKAGEEIAGLLKELNHILVRP